MSIRPLQTEQERRGTMSGHAVIVRLAKLVGVLLNPLGGAVAIATGLLLIRQRRIKPALFLSIAIVIGIGGLFFGVLAAYVDPWRQLANVWRHTPNGEFGQLADAAGALVRSSLTGWLIGIIPAGIVGGLVVGAGWAAFRWRRRATWRDEEPEQVEAKPATLKRAIADLPDWPTQPAEPDDTNPVPITDLRVRLGVTTAGTPTEYVLTLDELLSHVYVDAPTRFGKSWALLQLLGSVLLDPTIAGRHCPVSFMTFKPDPEFTEAIEKIAQRAGRRFWHVTEHGGAIYAPLLGKDADQIAAFLIETERQAQDGGFTEPHHARIGQRFLRYAARALLDLVTAQPEKWRLDLVHLAQLTTPEAIDKKAQHFGPQLAADWGRYKASTLSDKNDVHRSIAGIAGRLAEAAENASRHVLTLTDDGEPLILEDAIDAGDVIVWDLDAALDGPSARSIGNFVIQDCIASLARLNRRQWRAARDEDDQAMVDPSTGRPIADRALLFFVDEFSGLGGTVLSNLFDRAAGYGGSVLLSTQTAGSLDEAGDNFRETVMTNAHVKLFFQQGVNAEEVADRFGTEKVLDETVQLFEDGSLLADTNVYRSGQSNLKEVDKYVIHPNTLRRLPRATCAVQVATRDNERPAIVRVVNRLMSTAGADPLGEKADGDQDDAPILIDFDLDTAQSDAQSAPNGLLGRFRHGRRKPELRPDDVDDVGQDPAPAETDIPLLPATDEPALQPLNTGRPARPSPARSRVQRVRRRPGQTRRGYPAGAPGYGHRDPEQTPEPTPRTDRTPPTTAAARPSAPAPAAAAILWAGDDQDPHGAAPATQKASTPATLWADESSKAGDSQHGQTSTTAHQVIWDSFDDDAAWSPAGDQERRS